MHRLVAPAVALDDARFDVVASGERAQLPLVQHACEARQRAAHEQRLFLPVAAKKFARRQAAEQKRIHRDDYM